MKVLIIEDERELSDYIANALQESGHVTQQAFDGTEGLFMAQTQDFDVLIIDRMLPNIDGVSIIKSIREKESLVPILVLSALNEVESKIEGFSSGADDYLANHLLMWSFTRVYWHWSGEVNLPKNSVIN
ncbi:response regulator [Pseudoalteromonas sp. T1lg65]|uniref:response regulator n=1 Tax=Pseudoalteromonas sp. T1lg65 TaxID=2077101 RepID=UPI003F7A8B84